VRLFSDVSERIADPWLRRAYALAELGRGTTSPNPLVGCVLVRNGEMVGEGYHARAGLPHAEVVALRDAEDAAAGATVYVTLEPCTHQGRTPPCTDALLSAGVGQVVIGTRDPNTSVSGGGAQVLRAGGVEVRFAADPSPFLEQNEAWVASLDSGRPFVRVKAAVSLDGHPALRAGERLSITGASGAQVTAGLRAAADAVLLGAATVIADDPALTVRDTAGAPAQRQPLRVVLVRQTLPPVDARVFRDEIAATLVLAPTALARDLRSTLPSVVEVAAYDLASGLRGALRVLAERGVVDVLVEAGPKLLTGFWEDKLIDELILVQAGAMAGGGALGLFEGDATLEEGRVDALAHVMAPLEAGIVGDVVVSVWRPRAHVSPDAEHMVDEGTLKRDTGR
jgi:diaminohydroxyphosphoribosylaminopyrimidine deaminase/5-amino-6-(5-phosphoribosylamino)uracil reductase